MEVVLNHVGSQLEDCGQTGHHIIINSPLYQRVMLLGLENCSTEERVDKRGVHYVRSRWET